MILPDGYTGFLEYLKEKIRISRQRASLAVNKELLLIYWEIGLAIYKQQQKAGWGGKVVERLSMDLKSDFPDFKGLSIRNLKYMLAFAKAYPDFGVVQEGLAQSEEEQKAAIVQANLAQLPWYHHITLLDKVKDFETRIFYIQKSIENGWSRDVMVHQITSSLHERLGNSITNFKQTLPPIQSELAHQTLKNPYVLDFLNLSEDFKEKDLEKALVNGVKNFLLELGSGFAFVGNQKKFTVEDDEFFLDLLFYNYRLHCFVVIELKIGEFKPEFAGKLNFYINVVNEQLKGKEDNQTIGILLCKTPNQTVVRFSLQDIQQPIGVSEYHLQNVLPEKLRDGLPSVEEFEEELDREYQELKSPLYLKLEKIKHLLNQTAEDQHLREVKSNQIVRTVFHSFFAPLTELIFLLMKEKLSPMFIQTRISLNVNLHEMDTLVDVELKVIQPIIHGNNYEEINKLGIFVQGIGFKAAGVKSFDHWERLTIRLEKYAMFVGIREAKGEDIWMEKLYHEKPTAKEIQDLAERYLETWVDGVYDRISEIRRKVE